MYNTLDIINLMDNSDDNSENNSDNNSENNSEEENYNNFNCIYCECEDCYNISTKQLFNDYYCEECYPNINSKNITVDIIKLIYKQGIDNTYPTIGNRIFLHYKAFIINNDEEFEFYNTYKKGIKEIILGDESNLKLFNTVITSMNKGEQSIFMTNISYINFLKNIEETIEDDNNELEKFKFEIEIINIDNPIIFTKRIII